MLARAHAGISVRRLDRVSPLAVPVLLDIGRESVRTAADEDALLLETEALVAEAMGPAPPHVPSVLRANLRRQKHGGERQNALNIARMRQRPVRR
jgi:ATP-dependent Lhr-like helicase